MKNCLKACLTWLMNRRPRFYLGAYVVVILAFALAFSLLKRQFYHPYFRHEASFQEATCELRDKLTPAFQHALSERAEMLRDKKVYPEKTWLRDFRVGEDAVHFSILVEIRESDEGFGKRRWIPCRLTPDFAFDYRYKELTADHVIHLSPELDFVRNPSDSGPWSRSELDPILRLMLNRIEVDGRTVAEMQSLFAADKGIPSGIRGSFPRMLYLSVVTITTLGYGDIIPVGNWARFLVGCESVLGVILLGFFVSSVWSRSRKKENG
ncbi:MAG: potassium channel family protein [Kiritimatiellia bacterium]|nr:potassium channel family protein [Kiritimatiellia bacterium]MDP7022975.1 potassium channel family protein [Kiritimatiellia bacterium]